MSELANSLGIDGKKYLQIVNLNEEKINDIIIQTNNKFQVFSKVGLKIKCFHCEKLKKINIIIENSENIKEAMLCGSCNNIQPLKNFENNILFSLKQIINKYFSSKYKILIKRC